MKWLVLLSLLVLIPASGLRAQPTTAPVPGDELVISIVTMGPGRIVYERFGHNAIWVHDRKARTDALYNYGLFSFEQENFIGRFIQGHLLYWMEPHDVDRTIAAYIQDDRSIWIQELNLSADEKRALRDFLEWNAREENKHYRYDYYLDNCSTRVRDAIDLVLRGQIREQTQALPTGHSFRWHTDRIMAGDVPLYTALVYILGQPIEPDISVWDEMFLPVEMMEHLRSVQIKDPAGNLIPLIKSEKQIYQSTQPPMRSDPPAWTIWFALAGLLYGGAMVAATRRRWVLLSLALPWTMLVGFAGCFLAWGWTATDHWAVRNNENLLQFFPITILLVFFLPAGLWRRPGVMVWVKYIAIIVAGASLLGLLAKAIPGMDQKNAPIIALSLPIHLGLAIALWRWRAPPAAPPIQADVRRKKAR